MGRHARSVNEVAGELSCDRHTVNDTVLAYSQSLLDSDEDRIGEVRALRLDEVLVLRVGSYHRQHFTTQLIDVRRGQLLDIVPGEGAQSPWRGWESEGAISGHFGNGRGARMVYLHDGSVVEAAVGSPYRSPEPPGDR